jgi:chromosome segregation ATPase
MTGYMSDLSQLVDSLEGKISNVIQKNQELASKNHSLEAQLIQLREKQQEVLTDLDHWKENYETLKLANSMLGSNQDKRETKLKINALIRELDHCIAFISE